MRIKINKFSENILLNGEHKSLKEASVGAILRGVTIEGANLENQHFEGANLAGAYLKGAHLKGAHFENANLAGANLEGSYFNGTHFEGANLEGAFFRGSYFNGTHFENANLEGAHFEGAYFIDNNRFDGKHLRENNMEETNFKGANITGAHFEGSNIKGLHFEGSKIKDKNLVGKRPIICIGPIGIGSQYITSYLTNKGIFINSGLFTLCLEAICLDDFINKVKETYGDSNTGKECMAAVDFILIHEKLWGEKEGFI